ncbi:hypothetical protein R3P38DRAFT_3249639 [Favolaschia claudopus]|uniref:Uncharacterized protein n=1 Tax=Favolaschia claudopus TaxID=2862362 RepID=A0AAW0EGH9_9AGAR
MPSTVDRPTNTWWPRPQKSPSSSQVFSSEKPHTPSKGSGMKFNTLATAMGFKQKKSHPPPLTIHDVRTVVTPPAAHLAPDASPRRPFTAPSVGVGRAPSNSVSSSRSRGDSIGPTTPNTPEDPAQVRRGSLLTLSDADPFAARVVSLHSPSDPNRLSAYSNSSVHDTKSSESVNRVSYASSSSHSFRMGGDLSPRSNGSIISPVSEAGSSYKLSTKLSGSSLRRKDGTWLSNLGSGDPNRLSNPEPPPKPRPAMRARGMTDSNFERTNFIRSDPFMPAPKASPNIPARQATLSRPTPPPNQDLPPPPSSASSHNRSGPASSSSLTFSAESRPVSPRKGKHQAYDPFSRQETYDPSPSKASESGWEPDSRTHRTLKKSLSHQSLSKQRSPSTSTVPLPDLAAQKAPRKQRSFTQHRLPVPPVPLQLPLSEQRAAEPTRKRLFSSSSRRPSQSNLIIPDDARSLNTPPEQEYASSSCWIDLDAPPRSPTSTQQEYTPQQIMSPAEMLQLEASVEAELQQPRTRTQSILSASTAFSDYDTDYGLSPVSTFGGGRKRSNSDHPSLRSATSDGDMYYNQPLAPQPPSPPILMSLPPPPRRTKTQHKPTLSRSQSELITPLSPPPRRNLRPKISVEERMHRQSIMRKPSFLDIDDEFDKDSDPPPQPPLPRQASFLDLTRGSFDSMHSLDSLDYN